MRSASLVPGALYITGLALLVSCEATPRRVSQADLVGTYHLVGAEPAKDALTLLPNGTYARTSACQDQPPSQSEKGHWRLDQPAERQATVVLENVRCWGGTPWGSETGRTGTRNPGLDVEWQRGSPRLIVSYDLDRYYIRDEPTNRVARSRLATVQTTAASGMLWAVDMAISEGLWAEFKGAAAGECH